MKIKDLIQALSKFPEDDEVYMTSRFDMGTQITRINHVGVDKHGNLVVTLDETLLKESSVKPVKTYTIPKYGITVEVISMGGGTSGGIKSELKRHVFDGEPTESDLELHGAVHALESLILGHACAGLDIGSDAYVAGLDSAVEAIANNL